MSNRVLHIALPVLGEYANLSNFLDCLEKQSFKKFKIYICINQYEHWWDEASKLHYCLDNAESLSFLKSLDSDIEIVDRSSKGFGWLKKKGGVGWARKILMDRIAEVGNKDDIIVSMDADTYYPENYLVSIIDFFNEHPDNIGLSVPYFHQLIGDSSDRQILRYEIYMRYYALNMLRIKNPYNFTALGSALALPVWAYHKIGGMTPVKSGEDFYLLQKLVKNGQLGMWADTTAFPASRYSDRVLFGTGPALIKGAKGNWDSYPLYIPDSFDLIHKTFNLFPTLFERDVKTPMSGFLSAQFRSNDLWGPLRRNYRDRGNFIKACINKVDGLRILQFLRYRKSMMEPIGDETVLIEFLQTNFAKKMDSGLHAVLNSLNYADSSIQDIDLLRQYLFKQEMITRKKFMFKKQ